MPNPELLRPSWRDGNAYAETLSQDAVANEIKAALLRNPRPKFPLKNDTPQQDLDEYFPSLIKSLRLHDLSSCWYWEIMLGLCLVFLLMELFIVLASAPSAAHTPFIYSIGLCMIVLVALLLLNASVALLLLRSPSLPKPLRCLPPELFHAMPVIWVSICSVGLNFYVVTQTGYSNSPFLHALLASTLIVLSLSRENSIPVLAVAGLALAAGSIGASNTAPVATDLLNKWGGSDVAKRVVLLTFLYAGISAVVLRWIANYKLAPRNEGV